MSHEGKDSGEVGIQCPDCSTIAKSFNATYSKGGSVRRRYHCLNCLKRFTTYESTYHDATPLSKRTNVAREKFVELLSPMIDFYKFHFPEAFQNEKMPNELSKDTAGWLNSLQTEE